MNFIRPLFTAILVASILQVEASSDNAYTREYAFYNFDNINLPIQKKINKTLIKSLLEQSYWYSKNERNGNYIQPYSWKNGELFSTNINKLMTDNNRVAIIDDKNMVTYKGCVNELVNSQHLSEVLIESIKIPTNNIVIDVKNIDQLGIVNGWELPKEHSQTQEEITVWKQRVNQHYSQCNEQFNEHEYNRYFSDSLAENYAKRFRMFINQPNAQTANAVIDDRVALLVRENEIAQLNYNEIIKHAKLVIERSEFKPLRWNNGFPLNTSRWGACLDDKARNGLFSMMQLVAADSHLSTKQIRALLHARHDIAFRCENNSESEFKLEKYAYFPQQWRDYILGLDAFYAKDFVSAAKIFEKSYQNESDIIKHLSSYLAGRSWLIASQLEWRSWEGKGGIKLDLLEKSSKWFQRHINDDAFYVDSAFGLLGRVAYLSDDTLQYEYNLKQRFIAIIRKGNLEEFSNIIREYIHHEQSENLLIHINELRAEIENREDYTEIKNFFLFLQADTLFRQGQTKQAANIMLKLPFYAGYAYIMDYAVKHNDIEYERKAIQAFTQSNTKDLYLAELDYRLQGIPAFLTSHNKHLVQSVASSFCHPEDLKNAIKQSNHALYIQEIKPVLYRALLQRFEFKEFKSLFKESEFNLGDYELIRTAINQIAGNKNLGKAYMNIGYFMSEKEIYESTTSIKWLSERYPDTFCTSGIRNNRVGAQYFYQKALEQFSEDGKNTDEAKTLSFMINCDANGHNGCWGKRPRHSESSKVLFQRLHKKYPKSKWADQTPYYY